MRKAICKNLIEFINEIDFKLDHYSINLDNTSLNSEICYMYKKNILINNKNIKICLFIDMNYKTCTFLHCFDNYENVDITQDEIHYNNLYCSYINFCNILKTYYKCL